MILEPEKGLEQGSRASLHESLSILVQPAPLEKRILAFAVDLAILGTIGYLAFFVFLFVAAFSGIMIGSLTSFFSSLRGSYPPPGTAIAILLALLFTLLLALILFDAYFVYYEYKRGTTPGKKLFGLMVVSLKSPRLTLGQCLLREVLRHIDCTLVLPGAISVIVTQRKQRLGDLAAKTLVIHSKQQESRHQHLYLRQEEYHLLWESLSPQSVPEVTCRQYLKFAYPYFLLKTQQADSSVLNQWEDIASHYFSKNDPNLNRETRLRFFAEHCYQLLNKVH